MCYGFTCHGVTHRLISWFAVFLSHYGTTEGKIKMVGVQVGNNLNGQ